jgi:hypothetical protein
MHSSDSNAASFPAKIAAAAWWESLSLWCVQGGRSADTAVALATRRSSRAPAPAAAMTAAKVTRVLVCVKCSMPGQNAVVAELPLRQAQPALCSTALHHKRRQVIVQAKTSRCREHVFRKAAVDQAFCRCCHRTAAVPPATSASASRCTGGWRGDAAAAC